MNLRNRHVETRNGLGIASEEWLVGPRKVAVIIGDEFSSSGWTNALAAAQGQCFV